MSIILNSFRSFF